MAPFGMSAGNINTRFIDVGPAGGGGGSKNAEPMDWGSINWWMVGGGAAAVGVSAVVCGPTAGVLCIAGSALVGSIGGSTAIAGATGGPISIREIIAGTVIGGGFGLAGRALINRITATTTRATGAVRFGGHSGDDLSRAAAQLDRNGLTFAGRALQKHGDRPGSAFPRATGTSAQKNTQGQQVVDGILTNPDSRVIVRGDRIDIYAPDGLGVRFYPDGNFKGLLEP